MVSPCPDGADTRVSSAVCSARFSRSIYLSISLVIGLLGAMPVRGSGMPICPAPWRSPRLSSTLPHTSAAARRAHRNISAFFRTLAYGVRDTD